MLWELVLMFCQSLQDSPCTGSAAKSGHRCPLPLHSQGPQAGSASVVPDSCPLSLQAAPHLPSQDLQPHCHPDRREGTATGMDWLLGAPRALAHSSQTLCRREGSAMIPLLQMDSKSQRGGGAQCHYQL